MQNTGRGFQNVSSQSGPIFATPENRTGGTPVLHFALTLLDRYEFNADWKRHRQNLACWSQVAGLLIDLEDHDVVAVLVGCQQVAAAGSDLKVARCLATRGDVFQQFRCTGCGIEGEDGKAIVPAVRAIKKFSGGVHLDFRGIVLSLESLRQSRDCGQALQATIGGM